MRRTSVLLEELPYHLVVGLPALSPTMSSGSLAEWYLKEGDSFSAGDAIAKIETDKASMDFEAQDDGYIAKILMDAGDGQDVEVGTPILVTVEEEGHVAAFADFVAPASDAPPAAAAPAAAAPPPPAPEPKPTPIATPVAPEPVIVATPPPPPVAAPPPPVAAPVEGAPAFSTAWGLSVVNTSPLAKTLAKQQAAYIEKYGTAGQRPIA